MEAALRELAGEPVLVAVSGGPDSTALLVALAESSAGVVAAHYDHRLRHDSAAHAEHVARLCARLRVPLLSGVRAEPLPGGSRQAAARQLRYAFLSQAAEEAAAGAVLLAHTADDVAEGVLLHLLRGSGIAGLRGMPQHRGLFHRPLLGIWRSDVDGFLRARGIAALQDPSNVDRAYARARVRHELLPALEERLPGLRARLAGIGARAAAWQQELEHAAAGLTVDGRLHRQDAGALEPALFAEAVRQLYSLAGGELPALSRRHIEAAGRLVRGRAPGALDFPGGFVLQVGYEHVWIVRGHEESSQTPPVPARVTLRAQLRAGTPSAQRVYLQPSGVSVRPLVPGLRMRVSAGGRTRKLQDILVDAKVPRRERAQLPLVFVGERLAWVPGVALDPALAVPPGGPCVEAAVEIDFSSQEQRRHASPPAPTVATASPEAHRDYENPVIRSANLVRGVFLT